MQGIELKRFAGIIAAGTLGIGPAAAHDIEGHGDFLYETMPFFAPVYSALIGDYDQLEEYAAAYMLATAATVSLKSLTHKERPDGSNFRSFPSGHTKAAFVSAAYLHRRYGWETAWPAYLAAGYVGYTRVHSKKHYPIDVLAGAGIAIGTVFALVEPGENFTFLPNISTKEIGFSVKYKF